MTFVVVDNSGNGFEYQDIEADDEVEALVLWAEAGGWVFAYGGNEEGGGNWFHS